VPVDGMNDVTRVRSAIEQGDPHAAEQLLPLVYEELRKLAAQKMADVLLPLFGRRLDKTKAVGNELEVARRQILGRSRVLEEANNAAKALRW
jgi:hypothetical protein